MNKQTKMKVLAAAVAAAVVIAVICLALMGSTGSGSEKGVLQRFYTAMYNEKGGGINTMVACLAPERQQTFYNSITMGGTTFNQLATWRMEAMQLVGDQIDVKVTITGDLDETASDLAVVKQVYAGADRYRVVSFVLELTGAVGNERFVGVMPLVQIDGSWYMAADDAGLKRVVGESEAQ